MSPGFKLLMVLVVNPFDHRKLYPGEPPSGVTVADPFIEPKQDTFCEEVVRLRRGGSAMLTEFVVVHP
jgi:hypothetical protein